MTVAEALTDIKLINERLSRRFVEIRQYSSKREGGDDLIESQEKYVKEQRQSAVDLIKRIHTLKNAIQASNLVTVITWKEEDFTVADALVFKQLTSDYWEQLWDSFTDQAGKYQVQERATHLQMRQQPQNLTDKDREEMKLQVKTFYSPREIKDKQEALLEKLSYLDRLIDASNHKTHINL